MMVLNKSLQVIIPLPTPKLSHCPNILTGDQHPEHECGARGSNVQELPVERALPLRRSVIYQSLCTVTGG